MQDKKGLVLGTPQSSFCSSELQRVGLVYFGYGRKRRLLMPFFIFLFPVMLSVLYVLAGPG